MGGEGVAFGGLGRLVCAVVAEGSVVPVERDPADVPNGRSSVLCPPQMAAAAGLGASGGGGGHEHGGSRQGAGGKHEAGEKWHLPLVRATAWGSQVATSPRAGTLLHLLQHRVKPVPAQVPPPAAVKWGGPWPPWSLMTWIGVLCAGKRHRLWGCHPLRMPRAGDRDALAALLIAAAAARPAGAWLRAG